MHMRELIMNHRSNPTTDDNNNHNNQQLQHINNKVTEGKAGEVRFEARRIAFSAFGDVRNLAGLVRTSSRRRHLVLRCVFIFE